MTKPKYQLLPPLRTDEAEALRQSIEREGIRVPILVDEDGEVLDGHTRLQFDKKAPRRVVKGLTEAEKKALVFRLHRARRNMTADQWQDTSRQMRETALELKREGHTQADVAVELGVSQQTVSDWFRDIRNTGVGKADNRLDARVKIPTPAHPVIFERAERGELQEQIAADYGVRQSRVSQICRAEKKKRAESERLANSIADEGPACTVTSAQNVVRCDVLITDPPYGILDEPWEPANLRSFTIEWASRWNACGADLVLVFWSQGHLDDGKKWFSQSLESYTYQQQLVWHYPNNKKPQSRLMFKQTWEPIFVFRKRDCERKIEIQPGPWGDDLKGFDCHVAPVPQSNFNGANRKLHPAQKPLSAMRWLVAATTRPNELVCDPFCGSGTTGIAARQLGRRFHGIETDENIGKLARQRIGTYGISSDSQTSGQPQVVDSGDTE